MWVKTILYVILVPLTIWVLECLNINHLFKKNRVYQVRFLYLILSLSLSYLVVSCLFDFVGYTQLFS